MRAIEFRRHGGPEVMEPVDVPEPEARPGRVVVENHAIGVNFIDVYHRRGWYPLRLPFRPGVEACGRVIEAAGPWRAGDRVAHVMETGAYAERSSVPLERAVPVPAALQDVEVAAALHQGLTAHYLVRDLGSLGPGMTVLVHAAAGGVGQLAVQMARATGATVLGTASDSKRSIASAAGVAHVLSYDAFAREARELTGGVGVDVVLDGVGLATFEGSMRALRPRGRLVLFGQSSGPVPPFDPQVLQHHGSLMLTRPTLRDFATPEELPRRAGEVLSAVASGELRVRVDRRFGLEEAARAHELLEGRRTAGKLLLHP